MTFISLYEKKKRVLLRVLHPERVNVVILWRGY